jgi:uncharacterized protein (DUF885 family)
VTRRAAVVLLCVMVMSSNAGAQSPGSGARSLRALMDEYWEWRLREYPEGATWLGDHRYNDRLTDLSRAAIDSRRAFERQMLAKVRKIGLSKLTGQDALSQALLEWDLALAVEGHKFPSETLILDQLDGPQLSLPQLTQVIPFNAVEDYERYLARLAAIPRYFDQVTDLLRRGIEIGWTQPNGPLRGIPDQIQGQLGDETKSPFYAPFAHMPAAIPAAARNRLAAAGRKTVKESVLPTLVKFGHFVRDTYLPAGERPIAISSVPDGPAFYRYAIRRETTIATTPEEVHATGMAEVARIRKEMESVRAQSGFSGSFDRFLEFLRTDPRFYFTKPEDLVTAYRDVAKRADEGLPALFTVLPRNTYGVKAFPHFEAPSQTTARYYPGASDDSRPGYYMVNTYKLETRPKYEMEALTLHEAVPGHHLQIARAKELRALPAFRRNASYTAFVEGWALYAESLGTEMGFYKDPYSRFGQLTYEMWRACRLVVDTGMHHLGWSRQQAIDFMKQNTAKSEHDIAVEIDRYIVWPGQALAYKTGELKIKALRAKAERELGPRFNVRKFHNAVLDNGSLPLGLLEREIDAWIVRQKGAK